MEHRNGYFWLEKGDCPPSPSLGHGMGYPATLAFKGPGWYGPGDIVYSDRRQREYIWFERVDLIENNIKDAMRTLADRLRCARRFVQLKNS
jgi:hypothetical protein